MKKLFTVTFLLIATTVSAQKAITVTSKSTSAQLWPGEQNLCSYITLTVERKEITGQPTATLLGYQIRNCDDSIYAYTNPTPIPNESYVVDTRLGTHTLNVSSPIKASITWRYPINWRNTLNQTLKAESNGNIETTVDSSEETGATVEGIIGNRTVAFTSQAKVITDTKSVTKNSK